jgi:large subunit ribosomal protein L15
MKELSQLRPPKGATRNRKRRGRGIGSRLGKTSGRGQGGAGQRSGSGHPTYFEGGQMPLARRLPKRGFTNIFATRWAILNVKDLARFDAGARVDEAALKEVGLIKGRYDAIKVLGNGDIGVALTVVANKFSKVAADKIAAAGGTVEVVGG